MAEYSAEELAIIVRYDGAKSAFDALTDKSAYYGRVVFITGTTANGITTGQAIWVSETGSTSGKYLDMSNIQDIANQLTYVKGLKVGNTTYAGTITITGTNGISVTVSSNTMTFSGKALQDSIDSVNTTATNALNKANANGTAITNLGTTVSNIQNSLKGYATDEELADAKSEIVGVSTDGTTAMTLHGVKNYALAAANTAKNEALGDTNDDIEDETIRGNKNAIEHISDAFPVTISESVGEGDIAKVYTVKQGLNTIGTINIPKELVVTSGSVVTGTWSGTSFTESTSGAGKAIKLTIANQTTPIYINVKDLVDVYIAEDTSTIDITISTDNKISASVKSDSIQTSMLVNSAVTTSKINGGAVTTEKIADDAVSYDKLAQSVKTSLGKADNAVSDVRINISTDDADYLSGTKSSSDTIRTINLDVKTESIGNATSDTTKKGLATAEDVAAFIKARLSVRVVS